MRRQCNAVMVVEWRLAACLGWSKRWSRRVNSNRKGKQTNKSIGLTLTVSIKPPIRKNFVSLATRKFSTWTEASVAHTKPRNAKQRVRIGSCLRGIWILSDTYFSRKCYFVFIINFKRGSYIGPHSCLTLRRLFFPHVYSLKQTHLI